jgi:hypothetical protein
VFWCALLMTVATLPSQARGQFTPPSLLSRQSVRLPVDDPLTPNTNPVGLTAELSLTQSIASGSASVTMTFDSTRGPLSGQRNLEVRLTPIERRLPADQALQIRLPVTFPQGQRRLQVQRVFPSWTIGASYRVEVLEDGTPLPDFSAEMVVNLPGFALKNPIKVLPHEVLLDVLFVDTKAPSVDSNVSRLLTRQSNLSISPPQQVTWQELPDDWRLLRDIDCIVVPANTLLGSQNTAVNVGGEKLDSADPEGNKIETDRGAESALASELDPRTDPRTDALRHWLLMGGTLVVLDGASGQQIDRRLRLDLLSSRLEDTGNQAELSAGVLGAMVDPAAQILERLKAAMEGSTPGSRSSEPIEAPVRLSTDKMPSYLQAWSQAESYGVGVGRLLFLPSEAFESLPSATYQRLQAMIGYDRSTMLRRGVDPVMGDARHRRWLIPGVAQPPVYTFMGILTLFVLLVGPVAYRWTRRSGRSHLMFLIAPSLAVLTTVAMFAYSIVADGFGTKVRIRQITWIDSVSGDAAERTRSTYFAGISPSGGLRFDADSEITLYPSLSREDWLELPRDVNGVRLSVNVDDQNALFSRGVLPARSQTQFVTHRIRKRLGHVSLAEPAPFDSAQPVEDAQQSVTLTSRLPFDLRDVLVRSRDGRYWASERLPAGEAVEANWVVTSRAASKQMGELYSRHRPLGAASETGNNMRRGEIRDLIGYVNQQLRIEGGSSTDGNFESWLNQTLFVDPNLPAGMFVAVADPSDDVVAVAEADVVASVRYVVGALKSK